MRRRLVAGNWKMHGNRAANAALLDAVLAGIGGIGEVECAVCVPYPYLAQAADRLRGTPLACGRRSHQTRRFVLIFLRLLPEPMPILRGFARPRVGPMFFCRARAM